MHSIDVPILRPEIDFIFLRIKGVFVLSMRSSLDISHLSMFLGLLTLSLYLFVDIFVWNTFFVGNFLTGLHDAKFYDDNFL